jgi:hypothetical protein
MRNRMKVKGRSVTAAIVIIGGMTVVVGTLLPWMTLFGGLHTYRGVIGLYGRLIATGGVLAIALGSYLGARDNQVVRAAAAILGVTIFCFSTILIRNMMSIVGNHRGDPMMIAAPGWGLYVCLIGAALMTLSGLGLLGRDFQVGEVALGAGPDP